MKKNQKNEVQRFSARMKVEVVLRVLKGESLDELSRELAVPASRLSEWRDEFLRAGEASMKTREPNAQDEEIRKLKETIGSIAMENEVLREGVRKWKAGAPFVPGRWQS
jgi:hypothetical protein